MKQPALTDPVIHERFRSQSKIIKSLAHPTRLYIAVMLSEGPACVCEITERVGSDISTVSRHLSVMKNAGILGDERRGNQIWYSLRFPCVLHFLSCISCIESFDEENGKSEACLHRML